MATTSTFSGTAAASSGTFSDFVNRCQLFLNDEGAGTWDTEMIATFLNDAVRDYSQHFPRVQEQTIETADGIQYYDLAQDFLGVLSVEYPAGQVPPAYLSRKSYTAGGFWHSNSYYDILPNRSADDPDELWISADTAGGEQITVRYHALHTLIADPAAPAESLTVPQEHQQLLVKYVRWQAALHLASAEQQAPTSNSSLLMAQLAQNARRDELAYHTAVAQALYAAEGQSKQAHWTGNGSGVERIY